ncbi:MAG TPA: RHS repeat-associated core domain-containing protein [Terrimicrobiaceae bacterium]
MTSSGAPSGSRAFTYNSLNERITDAGVAQQFDANGNLSGGMGFTLTWDAEDRVKSISYNGTQTRVEYDYDGEGRRARIRQLQSGVTTAEYLYIWDGLEIVEKRDSTLPGFPVAMYFPQGERKFLSGNYVKYFYLKDRLGSVRGATSATGLIIQNSDFFPYGPPAPQQPVSTESDFGFTGHLKCPFTGLTLAPYRVLGYANWLSRDPLGETGGVNLYSYVRNNPVNFVDPLGLMCKEEWEALRDEYIRNALLSYLAGDLAMRAALMGGPMAPVNLSIAAAGLGGYIGSTIGAGISTVGAATSPSNTSSPNR